MTSIEGIQFEPVQVCQSIPNCATGGQDLPGLVPTDMGPVLQSALGDESYMVLAVGCRSYAHKSCYASILLSIGPERKVANMVVVEWYANN